MVRTPSSDTPSSASAAPPRGTSIAQRQARQHRLCVEEPKSPTDGMPRGHVWRDRTLCPDVHGTESCGAPSGDRPRTPHPGSPSPRPPPHDALGERGSSTCSQSRRPIPLHEATQVLGHHDRYTSQRHFGRPPCSATSTSSQLRDATPRLRRTSREVTHAKHQDRVGVARLDLVVLLHEWSRVPVHRGSASTTIPRTRACRMRSCAAGGLAAGVTSARTRYGARLPTTARRIRAVSAASPAPWPRAGW